MAVIQMRGTANAAAKKLLSDIGDITGMEVLNDRILIAIYRHEGVTEGGIITSAKTEDESDYQGKVGLVLKIGPLVNAPGKDAARGAKLEIGDWVVVNPSSGLSMNAGQHGSGRMIRMLVEKDIHMRVQRPDMVW
jgi:co-chaperonin GroES (HSP10)